MVASIGPFWDANETWLVLGVGLLLVAFPKAHGLVLSELYLPTALMLVGLILRGAAFDFRVKAQGQPEGDVGPPVHRRLDACVRVSGLDARSLYQRLRRGLELSDLCRRHRDSAADGIRAARRDLAGDEDGGPAPGQGDRMEQDRLAADGRGLDTDLDGNAVDQRDRSRQVVYLAGDDCGGVDPDHDGHCAASRCASCSARLPCAAACAGCHSHCLCSCSS